MFRAVISHEDPGIANWLDPAGLSRGTLSVRFLDADPTPDVRLERGAMADIVGRLPADTVRMTPERCSRYSAQ